MNNKQEQQERNTTYRWVNTKGSEVDFEKYKGCFRTPYSGEPGGFMYYSHREFFKRYSLSEIQKFDDVYYQEEIELLPLGTVEYPDARSFLDEWLTKTGHPKEKLLGYSIVADFAEDFVKCCQIQAARQKDDGKFMIQCDNFGELQQFLEWRERETKPVVSKWQVHFNSEEEMNEWLRYELNRKKPVVSAEVVCQTPPTSSYQ